MVEKRKKLVSGFEIAFFEIEGGSVLHRSYLILLPDFKSNSTGGRMRLFCNRRHPAPFYIICPGMLDRITHI